MKGFTVELSDSASLYDFVASLHYKGAVFGRARYRFALKEGGVVKGVAMFGVPSSPNVWKAHGSSGKAVLELQRLVCVDDTPPNAESFLIGACLRWLKDNTEVECVVSYADPEQGHRGTVYKASNFKLLGRSEPRREIVIGDLRFDRREMYRKVAGKTLPKAIELRTLYEEAKRSGNVRVILSEKLVYRYQLRPAPVALPEVRFKGKRAGDAVKPIYTNPFRAIFSESSPQFSCGII